MCTFKTISCKITYFAIFCIFSHSSFLQDSMDIQAFSRISPLPLIIAGNDSSELFITRLFFPSNCFLSGRLLLTCVGYCASSTACWRREENDKWQWRTGLYLFLTGWFPWKVQKCSQTTSAEVEGTWELQSFCWLSRCIFHAVIHPSFVTFTKLQCHLANGVKVTDASLCFSSIQSYNLYKRWLWL